MTNPRIQASSRIQLILNQRCAATAIRETRRALWVLAEGAMMFWMDNPVLEESPLPVV